MGIKFKNLNYSYTDGRTALHNINLEIEPGKKTAIIGLNGSGKSTLLSHINGMKLPQEGQVIVDDLEVNRQNLRLIRGKVGYVFDYPDHQLFSTTSRKDIEFGMDNYGYTQAQKEEKIKEIAGMLDIEDLLDFPPFHLSLGQKKRVALAGILVLQPDILVFDEPFSGLDNETVLFFQDFLDRQVQEGITMVYSNHDTDQVYAWADNVVVLEKGRVIQAGLVEEVMGELSLYENSGIKAPMLLELFKFRDDKPRDMKTAKKLMEEMHK